MTLDSLFIERAKEAITEIALRESSARLVPSGTVLMTSRATIGHTAITTRPMATNQGFANFICCERLAPEYLAHWLRHQRGRLIGLAGGTTFREIPKSTIKRVLIPLPPLDEQLRIVGVLNRAAKIERLRAQAAERLQEFIPALFVRMFGDPVENPRKWEVKPLGDFCISTQYGTSKKANDRNEGASMLRMGNVSYDGDLDCGDLKHVVLSEADFAKYELRTGDILFNRTNSKDLVGKTGIWDGRFPAVAASYFIRLRLDEACVRPDYVWAFMNSRAMKRHLFSMARGAIGQANINAKEVESLPLPVPPFALQRRFGDIVIRNTSTTSRAGTAAAHASALTASLMARLLAVDS